jgi:predicted AAA+ superfamily ATPase
MLKRKAYKRLLEWKETKTKQGLLVTGARQVGKTFIIREFAREHYSNFVEFNFIDDKEAARTLSAAENSTDLFRRLSLLAGQELIPGGTLIFFDEVQECKEIVTAIKFLMERGGFDFVLSGSLLGVELRNIGSVPVGYLDLLPMYPMDFEEYCTAKKVPADAMDAVTSSFDDRLPVPDYLHDRLLKLFYEYLIIGGMPAVVDVFIETQNLGTVRRLQENLIQLNRQDISKYGGRNALVIKEIYDLIPSELNNQNKRFVLKDMNEHARFNRYQEYFVWLMDAGVALPVFNVNAPTYPLLLSKASNLFKLFMSDVGLLTSTFLKETSIELLNRNPKVNYGSIYENAAAQELAAQGFDVYYYKSKKRGELDMLVSTPRGTILPIEVKSGKDYKRHNALSGILSCEEFRIGEGFVLSDGNIAKEGRVTYLPIYMASCLKRIP